MADARTDVPVDAFAFRAPLSVCMDVTHPLAYLALGPVEALAAELGVAVDWLPFAAAGLKPPPPPGEERGVRHRRNRAAYQASEIERYAEAQGLRIREPFRDVDGGAACLGHLWLRERAPAQLGAYLRALFQRLWDGELGALDTTLVAGVIDELGDDSAAYRAFAAGPGNGALAALRESLVAAGVFTVPSLVVAGEVFVGRAHLPMVRWLLGGRAGPAPI